MTTLFIATSPEDISNLLPWAWHLAESRQEQLTVLVGSRSKGETRLTDVAETAKHDESDLLKLTRNVIQQLSDDDNSAQPQLQLKQIRGGQWSNDIRSVVDQLQPNFVITRAPSFQKNQTGEAWQTSLTSAADYDTMLIRDDAAGVHQPLSLAVFITDEADNEYALRCARRLTKSYGGTITAVYVQPNVSDDSVDVGERQLSNMLSRLIGGNQDSIKHSIIVAQSTTEAFRELNASDYHMLLMGTKNQQQMRRFFRANPVTEQGGEVRIPAVAVLQRGSSLGSQIRNKAVQRLKSVVPQLSREERVHLVTRIQESSQWDFDFVLLISLATFIGCLGLAENSAAVIVGAMLVAPLMTPIAGVGLGVAHANAYLTKVAFRTAVRGFATAIFIGLLFGCCIQFGHFIGWLDPLPSMVPSPVVGEWVVGLFPSEVEGRTKPQFYDLLIALASGIAAAYAMGRPNLYSALPGVAIAAALVPPIAVSGIAFSYGEFLKSGGALLLFVTNMVTIILGASLVFSAVGIRSQKEGPNAAKWPRYTLLLLVILSILITVVIELHGQHRKSLEQQRTQISANQ
ncbi:MAG: DUF389 domain-containing protein [Fuerstiella sp.]